MELLFSVTFLIERVKHKMLGAGMKASKLQERIAQAKKDGRPYTHYERQLLTQSGTEAALGNFLLNLTKKK